MTKIFCASGYVLAGTAFTIALSLSASSPAEAEQGARGVPAEPQSAPVAAGPSQASTRMPVNPFGDRDFEKFSKLQKLLDQGRTTILPPTIDSISGDAGGWRSKLAEYGIGVQANFASPLMVNFLHDDGPKGAYAGQTADALGANFNPEVVIGLDWLGLSNAKLVVDASIYGTTFKRAGPSFQGFSELAYYQKFFNGAMDIKAGFNINSNDFVGEFPNGSVTLTQGLQAIIPNQVGLSAGSATPTPTFNFTFYGKEGLYFRGGVQRSVSPEGRHYEIAHNGIGLDFNQDDAKALYIGEAGINRDATPDQKRLWFRVGAMYNSTKFQKFKGGKSRNKGFYGLIDAQVTQPHPSQPTRGLYLGGTAEYAPENVNINTQSYSARAFYIGLYDSRPMDTVSAGIEFDKRSDDAAEAYSSQLGVATHTDQTALSLNYAAHMAPGVYAIPGIQYVHNPAFTGDHDDPVLGTLTLLINF